MNRKALGRSLGDYIKYLEQLNGWIQSERGSLLEREFARAFNARAQIP